MSDYFVVGFRRKPITKESRLEALRFFERLERKESQL